MDAEVIGVRKMSRHAYAQNQEYSIEPEQCDHDEEYQQIVIDSIGEITDRPHQEFIECTNCGAMIEEEDEDNEEENEESEE